MDWVYDVVAKNDGEIDFGELEERWCKLLDDAIDSWVDLGVFLKLDGVVRMPISMNMFTQAT